jgi:hypothetical protein
MERRMDSKQVWSYCEGRESGFVDFFLTIAEESIFKGLENNSMTQKKFDFF